MIRVRLADPANRDAIAAFLRFANLEVTYPDSAGDTLHIDFAAFDFDETVQLRIVRRMLEAWELSRHSAVLAGSEIAVLG